MLAIAGLFIGLRVALMVARQPFYDELFTLWFSARPFASIWSTLQQDSSSLLHYGLVRLVALFRRPDLVTIRIMSLVFAGLTGWVILRSRQPWSVRAIALLLLAVFPAHVFFSTEARAYALVALFIGIATFCLHDWMVSGSRRALGGATLATVLAAYAHAYGVLFFPVPLVVAFAMGDRERRKAGAAATAIAGILFLPGFWLAAHQPSGSLLWMQEAKPLASLISLKGPPGQLGFAAQFPSVLLPPSPVALQIVSVAFMAAVLAGALLAGGGARIFALILLTPCALLLAFAVAGRTFYFPARFESTLAVPLCLMIASTVNGWRRPYRLVVLTVLCSLGILSSAAAIGNHANRPEDPYRSAARFVREKVPSGTSVVASGYAYLEVYTQQDGDWRVRLESFPSSQALHPGWWVNRVQPEHFVEAEALMRRRPAAVLWVGHRGSAEFRVLSRRFRFQGLFEKQGVSVGWLR